MKKRIPLLLFVAPMLLACGPQTPDVHPSSSAASSTDASQSTAPAGETYLFYQLKPGADKNGLEGAPWVNSVKEGVAAKLEKSSEKDDFYFNKTYQMQLDAKLEEGDIAVGGMPGAIKTVSKRTTRILTEKTSSVYSDALTSFYSLFQNQEKSGEVQFVKGIIDEIKAISSLDAMAEYLKNKGYDLVWPLFELIHTGENQVSLCENNLGMTPSHLNYAYLNETEEIKQRILDTTVYLLGLYGYDAQQAKTLLDNATAAYRDATDGNHGRTKATVVTIDEEYPNLRLKDYFTKLGYAATDEIVIENNIDSLLRSFAAAWNAGETGAYALSLDAMKAILIFRQAFASVISRGMEGEHGFLTLTQGLNPNGFGYNADMFEKEIFGSFFHDLYDRVYIDNYETKQRRDSILTLMNEISAEYKTLLNGSTWLDASTRQEAIDKLSAMTFDACYPVYLESLPSWNLPAETSFMQAANDYSAWSRLASQPVNDKYYLWAGTVTTVNGIYNSVSNSFVIYDGLLASDSYKDDMSKEELYGSIGAVIGHEISHAFDVSGSTRDKTGETRDWWTAKDKTAYAAKVQKIKDTWTQYENKPGMKLSCDDKMLGEIIADMGGVSVCLRLGAKQENFDYDKFFTSYALTQGSVMPEATLNNLVYGGLTGQQDSHPIPVFRVNGVVNQFEKFYETYNVTANDKMYVAAENRLNIWG